MFQKLKFQENTTTWTTTFHPTGNKTETMTKDVDGARQDGDKVNQKHRRTKHTIVSDTHQVHQVNKPREYLLRECIMWQQTDHAGVTNKETTFWQTNREATWHIKEETKTYLTNSNHTTTNLRNNIIIRKTCDNKFWNFETYTLHNTWTNRDQDIYRHKLKHNDAMWILIKGVCWNIINIHITCYRYKPW